MQNFFSPVKADPITMSPDVPIIIALYKTFSNL